MRTFLLFLCCAVCGTVFAQESEGPITDGPYVFYQNGVCYVKSVRSDGGVYKAFVDSFPEDHKEEAAIDVHLDKHPEWDFSVQLKKKIEIPEAVSERSGRKKYRTLILSDIEGEFAHFRDLLLAAHVINKHYKWRFGKGKLIIAGDHFDRGKQVAQYLWLLYKLEDEAVRSGGEVHVVLGNHDIMNLDGDFQYVRPEYMANAELMLEAYSSFYGPDTELGRWLRSKNIIERIDGLLVMHGGVSSEVLAKKKSIEDINRECRSWYATPPKEVPDSLKDFFNENALFWYRGYFYSPKAKMGLVDSTLDFYHADKIVVGHDIIHHVGSFYEGKVIGVDVDEHGGTHEGLVLDKGKYYRINSLGKRRDIGVSGN